jgi:hypothetical protein
MMRDSRLPFTVLLPDTRTEPIEIHDHLTALRLCLVEKDGVKFLDDSWDVPGAYVLLDAPDADGAFASTSVRRPQASDRACWTTNARRPGPMRC